MAQRGTINEFFNEEEFKRQLKVVTDGILEFIALTQKNQTIKLEIKDSKNFQTVIEGSKQLVDNQQKLVISTEKVIVAEIKQADAERMLNKALVEKKLATQEYNKELKSEVQLQNAAVNSENQAIASNKLLLAERKNLNGATAEGKKRIEEINAAIDHNNEIIRKNSSTLEKQRLNIGNYSGAVKVLEVALNEVRNKLDEYTKSGKASEGVIAQLRKEEELLSQLVEGQAAGFANATQELRANQKALLQMEQAGLQGTKAFQSLALQTGKLKDQVSDLTKRTKVLGSDTFVFDGMIQAAQGLAGIYGVAQGAAALFGNENKDLQKTFVKLQAIMTVIHGLQAIANAAMKEGAAVQLLSTIRTKALAAAQTLYAFATGGATVATKALRVAFLATGIGAVLLLLSSAASAMGVFGKSTKAATTDLEGFNDQMDRLDRKLGDTLANIQKNNKLIIETAKQRGASEAELNALSISGQQEEANHFRSVADQKIEAAKKFARENGLVVKQQINDAKDAEKELARLQKLSRVEGLNEDLKKKAEAGIDILKDVISSHAEATQKERDIEVGSAEFRTQTIEKRREQEKKAAEERVEKDKEAAEKRKEIQQRELAAQFEIISLGVQREIEKQDSILTSEESSFGERLTALSKFLTESKRLIVAQSEFEKKRSGLTPAEVELIETQKLDALIKLQEAGEEKKKNITIASNELQLENHEALGNAIALGIEKQVDAFQKGFEARKKLIEEEKQLYKDLAAAVEETIASIVEGSFEKQKNAIQEEVDLLEERKQKEIEAATQSIASVTDRAAAISLIEAKAEAQREQLERRKRQIQEQEAKFEQKKQIFDIGVELAKDLFKIKAAAAVHFAAGNFPLAALALSQIPILLGIAGLQIGAILAKGIPKYGEGTEDHPGGPAKLGDKGKHEMAVTPDGKVYKSPATTTVVNLPQHTVVYPDFDAAEKALLAGQMHRTLSMTLQTSPNAHYDFQNMTREIKGGLKSLEKTIKNKKEIHFKSPSLSDRFIKQMEGNKEWMDMNELKGW